MKTKKNFWPLGIIVTFALFFIGMASVVVIAAITAAVPSLSGSNVLLALLAIGFTADQMSAEMKTVNFGKFLDSWTDKVDVEKVILELMSGTFDWWDLANYWRIAMMAEPVLSFV